jgi:hypothetical protein
VTRHVTGSGGRYRAVNIDGHIPPPHMRDEPRKAAGAARTQRWRLHKAGDHSTCLPAKCPDAPVTDQVTRHPGTGQDGPGREELPPPSETREKPPDRDNQPFRPGGVDLSTGELAEPCAWCSGDPAGCIQCRPDLFGMSLSA